MPDPQTYTVTAAAHKKDVDGRHGPMKVLTLTLTTPDGEKHAEWFTKADTPIPEPGAQLTGTLQDGQYGLNFKKAQQGGGGFFGGGRPRDPQETARIQRQHSQEMALRYAQIRATQGMLAPETFTLDALALIADWFDRDIREGAGRALVGTSQPAREYRRRDPVSVGGSDVSADAEGFEARPAVNGDDIEF